MLHERALSGVMCVAVLGLMAWSSPGIRAAEEGPVVESKDAVMAALQRLQKGVSSYTATGRGTLTMGDRTSEQTVTIVAKAPGKYRETVTSQEMGERVTVCDGWGVWLPPGREGQVGVINRALAAEAMGRKPEDGISMYLPRDPVDLANPFNALKADTIQYTGKAKMGDAGVYVFEGQAKWPVRQRVPGGSMFWPRQKMLISVADGLLRSVTTYNREGGEMRVLTYAEVRANVPVEDSVFVPTGVERSDLEDATDVTIHQMKQAEEEAAKQQQAPAAQAQP